MPRPLQEMINMIYKIDRRIRYAAVLDRQGRVLAGGMRRGIISLEPVSEDLRLMAHITSEIGTYETWDRYFGKTHYTFIKRDNVNIMVFNLGLRLVLVSMEPDCPLEMVSQIKDVIANFPM